MKNTEKGITLVALIITIVILLILAVVAISGIENNDLITKVDDAVGKHDAAKAKEDGILDGYTGLIDKYLGGNTITECLHDNQICSKCGYISDWTFGPCEGCGSHMEIASFKSLRFF